MGFKSICYSTSLLEWHCSAEFKPKKRKKRFQAKSFAQTEFSGNILGLSKKSESFRSLINLALVQVLERECCSGCSLRSWRYCLGARLQFLINATWKCIIFTGLQARSTLILGNTVSESVGVAHKRICESDKGGKSALPSYILFCAFPFLSNPFLFLAFLVVSLLA